MGQGPELPDRPLLCKSMNLLRNRPVGGRLTRGRSGPFPDCCQRPCAVAPGSARVPVGIVVGHRPVRFAPVSPRPPIRPRTRPCEVAERNSCQPGWPHLRPRPQALSPVAPHGAPRPPCPPPSTSCPGAR
jgi:hypothetical protein